MEELNTTTFSSENEEKKIDVEIGDSKQEAFFPQVKIKKWDNEVNFSVRHIIDEQPSEVTNIGGVVTSVYSKHEARFYEKKLDFLEENRGFVTPVDYSQDASYDTEFFPHVVVNGKAVGRDTEAERIIRETVAQNMRGDVLVVGLGLGVINEYLKANPAVKSITVVEINASVIQLVQKMFPERLEGIEIITQDFYDFVALAKKRKFDSIYGDIFPFNRVGDILKWEDFLSGATALLKKGGQIDGRIKEQYDALIANPEEDSAMEFDLVLNEKPDSNVFEFSLQTKGLDFFYQPPMTQEEFDAGDFQPVSVAGSYAIYHSSKTDNEYKAGKVGHIYRPKVIDATGAWVWGELNVDVEAGTLSVTVPQDFLDNGAYPIIVDPTFGYTTNGATNRATSGNIRGSEATSGADAGGATVTGMSVVTSGGDATINNKANIYDASNNQFTNGQTNQRTTLASGGIGQADYTFASNPVIAATTVYILCVWAASGKFGMATRFDAGAANQGKSQVLAYGTWPNPLVPTLSTDKFTLWATYTPAGTSPKGKRYIQAVNRASTY